MYPFFDVSDVAFCLFLLWLIFVDVLTFPGFTFYKLEIERYIEIGQDYLLGVSVIAFLMRVVCACGIQKNSVFPRIVCECVLPEMVR